MEYVIRVDVSDSLTVEALEKAKLSRKMARLVTDALSHYVRTKEGKASIELLSRNSSPRPQRQQKPRPAKAVKSAKRVGGSGKEASLTETLPVAGAKTVKIDDFLNLSSGTTGEKK